MIPQHENPSNIIRFPVERTNGGSPLLGPEQVQPASLEAQPSDFQEAPWMKEIITIPASTLGDATPELHAINRLKPNTVYSRTALEKAEHEETLKAYQPTRD